MAYKVVISTIAKSNIRDALVYYKNVVSLKVAQNFVKDYENTLLKITQNPFFQLYYKDFRGLVLKKFPYIIFYQVDEPNKIIIIKAVFNTHQNTFKRPV